jgi:hypothetical protein
MVFRILLPNFKPTLTLGTGWEPEGFILTVVLQSVLSEWLWQYVWRSALYCNYFECSWLRHCATNRKVAGLIPDGVIGIFHWHNPSSCSMALGLIQPLTELSTRNISWEGRGSRCIGLTTLPPSFANCHEIWEPQPPGTLRTCPGLHREFLYLTTHILSCMMASSAVLFTLLIILHRGNMF